MGGSILGSQAIYDFLKPKFKNILFIDNFKKERIKKRSTKFKYNYFKIWQYFRNII